MVKKRPAGHPFQGQQKLHLLSFEVVEDISSQECLDIIKVQGDIALCPGPNLWRLAKRELPELSWFFCFEKRNEGNKEKNYFWKIDGSVGEEPEDSAKFNYGVGTVMDYGLRKGDHVLAAYYTLREIKWGEIA